MLTVGGRQCEFGQFCPWLDRSLLLSLAMFSCFVYNIKRLNYAFLPVRKFASRGNHTIIFCELKDSPVLQIIGQDER